MESRLPKPCARRHQHGCLLLHRGFSSKEGRVSNSLARERPNTDRKAVLLERGNPRGKVPLRPGR